MLNCFTVEIKEAQIYMTYRNVEMSLQIETGFF